MSTTAPESFDFAVTDRPKVTRTRPTEPNPFDEPVADFAKNGKDGNAVTFTVPDVKAAELVEKDGKSKTVLDPKITKILRQLREAGRAIDKTVRTSVTYADNNARVSFWTADKVKAKDAAPTTDTPDSP